MIPDGEKRPILIKIFQENEETHTISMVKILFDRHIATHSRRRA